MGEIVSLRRVRKQKARTEKEKEAAANRVKFGRSREEREFTDARRLQAEHRLDDHKRDK